MVDHTELLFIGLTENALKKLSPPKAENEEQ